MCNRKITISILVSILILVLAGCQNDSTLTNENVQEKTAIEEKGQEAKIAADDGGKAVLEENGNQQKKEAGAENTIYNVFAKKLKYNQLCNYKKNRKENLREINLLTN